MQQISFRARLMLCMALITLAAFAAPLYYARVILHEEMLRDAEADMLAKTAALAARISGEDPAALKSFGPYLSALGLRATLISAEGAVLADSGVRDGREMDNHADRPEVAAAVAQGRGVSVRHSLTLNSDMLYGAARCADGRVVRLAMPFVGLKQEISSRGEGIMLAALAALLCALLLSWLLSAGVKKSLERMIGVVENISLGNYACRLRRVPGREFAPLAEAVNRMAENIENHVRTVQDQAAQLESVLDTMDDGVLVLDGRGRVRRYNRALARLFPHARESVNAPVVEIVPAPRVQAAVDALLARSKGMQQAPTGSTVNRRRSVQGVTAGAGDLPHASSAEDVAAPATAGAADAIRTVHAPTGCAADGGSKATPPKTDAGAQAAASCGTETDIPLRDTQLQVDIAARSLNVHLSAPLAPTEAFGAVAVFRDVSELLRLERVRQDFVANASHELRTPLTAIHSYAETLAELEGGEEQQHFCAVILKNTAYLRRLIDELLTLTRLEREGGEPMEMRAVNPHECLEDAVAFCARAAAARHVTVRDVMAPDRLVLASAPHLTQVFCNLLENACRYAPEDSLIEVTGEVRGGMWTCGVADHGPGIPREDQQRVFERFYRVEKHRGQGSTGLGLAICKHIVERHGGRIWVESPARTAATVFHFTLRPAPPQA